MDDWDVKYSLGNNIGCDYSDIIIIKDGVH